jgi:hypothetical protein
MRTTRVLPVNPSHGAVTSLKILPVNPVVNNFIPVRLLANYIYKYSVAVVM